MLTSRSQKELATNSNITGSTIRRDVTNAHTIVSNVRNDVVKTGTIVSDTHSDTFRSPEDTHGQDRMVSITCTLLAVE